MHCLKLTLGLRKDCGRVGETPNFSKKKPLTLEPWSQRGASGTGTGVSILCKGDTPSFQIFFSSLFLLRTFPTPSENGYAQHSFGFLDL